MKDEDKKFLEGKDPEWREVFEKIDTARDMIIEARQIPNYDAGPAGDALSEARNHLKQNNYEKALEKVEEARGYLPQSMLPKSD